MRDYEHMDAATAQVYLDRYVASLPDLRARLALRLETTGGPVVDGSLQSVDKLDPWYKHEIQRPSPDGLDDVPLWWDSTKPGLAPSDVQLRLVDEVGAYLASVLQHVAGGAEWAVRKQRGGARTVGHHTTVLRLGPKGAQVEPWNLAYGHVADMLGGRPLRENELRTAVMGVLELAGLQA